MVNLGQNAIFIWLIGAYAFMVVISITVPGDTGRALGSLGIVILVVGILFQNLYAKVQASEFSCLTVFIRPSWVGIYIFFTRFYSEPANPNFPNRYVTKFWLGKPIVHRKFGKIDDYIIIYHWGTFEENFRFLDGYVVFNGMYVKHHAVDHAVLYEIPGGMNLIKSSFVEKAKPRPVYELIESGKKYPWFARVMYDLFSKRSHREEGDKFDQSTSLPEPDKFEEKQFITIRVTNKKTGNQELKKVHRRQGVWFYGTANDEKPEKVEDKIVKQLDAKYQGGLHD